MATTKKTKTAPRPSPTLRTDAQALEDWKRKHQGHAHRPGYHDRAVKPPREVRTK